MTGQVLIAAGTLMFLVGMLMGLAVKRAGGAVASLVLITVGTIAIMVGLIAANA